MIALAYWVLRMVQSLWWLGRGLRIGAHDQATAAGRRFRDAGADVGAAAFSLRHGDLTHHDRTIDHQTGTAGTAHRHHHTSSGSTALVRNRGGQTTTERTRPMGLDDKIKNATEDMTGKGKQAAGDAKGDDKLKAEGKSDQTKADVKKAGENVKDAFKK